MKSITWLRKFVARGDKGYPVATLAFYGPDDKMASKAVLGIFAAKGDEPQLQLATTQKLLAIHKCSLDYVGGKCGTRIRNRIWSLSEGHVYGRKTNATSVYTTCGWKRNDLVQGE